MEALAPNTQATLLLTTRLGASDIKPLSLFEYNALARQLVERAMQPGDLMVEKVEGFAVGTERLQRLLGRGAALAIAVERWSQSGIRPIGRSDADYPVLIRTRLRSQAVPVMFASGTIEILTSDALCIVGSRDATPAGLSFASCLGTVCAREGIAVVSGDARGVDREAMHTCLTEGGLVVGVLAESMSAAVLARRNREAILAGRLLLFSPFDPDARFTVSQAMERNRYLYALAGAAVVVDSGLKGGTWSGALENQKHKWTPAFVRIGREVGVGNSRLAEAGLELLYGDECAVSARALLDRTTSHQVGSLSDQLPLQVASQMTPRQDRRERETNAEDLFALWVTRLLQGVSKKSMTFNDIISRFALQPEQARVWLQRAIDDGVVVHGSDVDTYAPSEASGLGQGGTAISPTTANV